MKRKVIIITLLLCYFSLLTCNKIKKEMLVTTGEVSDITVVSADLSGAVVDLGENPVQHGHCYGNSPNLTINNSKTTLGKPIKGGFTSQLADLNPGTKYYFKAYITDGDETVYGAEKSFSTLAGSAPNAPVIGTATAGNQQAVITFTAPANNGGSAITGYTVTSNPGGLTGTGTASPITVTGLSNGTAYTFVVTATNIIGTGSPSSASNSVTPSTVPGAPTIGTATAGNQQAVITFTAPLNNGGSAITLYTVTSNPGGLTKTGTSSPITVTGLTNGTAYTFTVTATNANGIGPASTASNSITPVAATTVPGAPTIGTATAGNLQATITFTAPSNNGGSAITGYTVISNPGGLTGTGTASPITVTGLTNGTAYTFTVTATNAVGTGPASSASNSITPVAATTVPGAPTIGTATAGNSQATITFTAPANDGGSAITGYTVISNPGGLTGTGTASPITVTGLTNGTAYTFTVTATNAVGTGPASTASNSITPVAATTVPGAPTIGTVTAGNSQATITFTAPANDGGSAITGYTVISNPGGLTETGTASPITVTGLTNGTAYTFTVTATNAVGTGPASSASNPITPVAPPTATTTTATSVSNTSATLNGTVNANNLSTTITFEYGLTTSYGSTTSASPSPVTGNTSTSVSATKTGLTEGTTYHYRIKAVSAGGTTYGSDLTFTTTVSDKDGNIYHTIAIGTQVWLIENLKTTKYNDGTSIPLVTDNTSWKNLTTAGYCWYYNDASTYKAIYGALYNWYAVSTGKLCPTGWHVPFDAEWNALATFLGGKSVAGGKLKESGTAHWNSPNTGATNETGFSALPGDCRGVNGTFEAELGNYGAWWTSSEYDATNANRWYMRFDSNGAYNATPPVKYSGFSVRCIKD